MIHTFYSPDVDMINGLKMAIQVALQTVVILSAALVTSGRVTSNVGEQICIKISLVQIFLAVPEQIWGVVSKIFLSKSGPPSESDFKATAEEMAVAREKQAVTFRQKLNACTTVLKSIKQLTPALKTGDPVAILIEVVVRKKLFLSLEMLQAGKLCVIFQDVFRCEKVRQALDSEMRSKPEISPSVQALLANKWLSSAEFRDGIFHMYNIKAILEGLGGESELVPPSKLLLVDGKSFGWSAILDSNSTSAELMSHDSEARYEQGAIYWPLRRDNHVGFSIWQETCTSVRDEQTPVFETPYTSTNEMDSIYREWVNSHSGYDIPSKDGGGNWMREFDPSLTSSHITYGSALTDVRLDSPTQDSDVNEAPPSRTPYFQPPPYQQRDFSLTNQSELVFYHMPVPSQMYSAMVFPKSDRDGQQIMGTALTKLRGEGLSTHANASESFADHGHGSPSFPPLDTVSLECIRTLQVNEPKVANDIKVVPDALSGNVNLARQETQSLCSAEQFKEFVERVFGAIDSETADGISEKLLDSLPEALTSLMDEVPEGLDAAASFVELETDPNEEEEEGDLSKEAKDASGGKAGELEKSRIVAEGKGQATAEGTGPDVRGWQGTNGSGQKANQPMIGNLIGGAAFGSKAPSISAHGDPGRPKPATVTGSLRKLGKVPIKKAAPAVRMICGLSWDWFLFWLSVIMALVALFVLTALANTQCSCGADGALAGSANATASSS